MCVERGAEVIGSKTRCSWFLPQMVEYRCVINIIRTLAMSWIPSPVLPLFSGLIYFQDINNCPSTALYRSQYPQPFKEKMLLTNDSNKYLRKGFSLTSLVHMPWPPSTKGKGLGRDCFICTTWYEGIPKGEEWFHYQKKNRQFDRPRQGRIFTHGITWNKSDTR